MTTKSRSIKNGEVLFQKIGNKWFIFAEVNGEAIYSTLPDGIDPLSIKIKYFYVLEEHLKKQAEHKKDTALVV